MGTGGGRARVVSRGPPVEFAGVTGRGGLDEPAGVVHEDLEVAGLEPVDGGAGDVGRVKLGDVEAAH